VSPDSHKGQVISQVGQSDRPQIGMLDSPPVALNRGDRHAQSDRIAFPRNDKRIEPPLAGGVSFDRTGDGRRGGAGSKLEYLFTHDKVWYTGPVIVPLEGNLASMPRTVKQIAYPRRGDTLFIEPIKKTRLAEEVADRIRMLILNGTFPPGNPLPSERLLTKRLGVSRGSLRDALRMLEMIGLLETRHGQGTFPHELTVDRLVAPLASVMTYRHDLRDELMDVRRMFEPAVARVAATRVTDEDLAGLQYILDAQRRKLETGQSTIVEDTAFHAALAKCTHNRVAVSIMATLNDLLVESRKLTLKQHGRPAQSVAGHEAVVAALRRRDAEAAAQAMSKHIDQIAGLQLQAQELVSEPGE
jgi:GntR family transcriptional regulator, transcriptional repressor for pyruvate dehydrogenase complex